MFKKTCTEKSEEKEQSKLFPPYDMADLSLSLFLIGSFILIPS